jgi:hypothetical protein
MATRAAWQGWKVIYLTKGTRGRVLHDQLKMAFNFFQAGQEVEPITMHCKSSDWVFGYAPNDMSEGQRQIKVLLLNKLLEEVEKEAIEKQIKGDLKDILKQKLKAIDNGDFLAFADFSDVPFALRGLDRYIMTDSAHKAIALLQPRLMPVFYELLEGNHEQDKLLVVCDSLSAEVLGEHLPIQSHQGLDAEEERGGVKSCEGEKLSHRPPVLLFVLESSELPESMNVAFPPDFHIRLGVREEAHRIRTKTFQLVKTRFQNSLDEATPFMISEFHKNKAAAQEYSLSWEGNKPSFTNIHSPELRMFTRRQPGIEIMAPVIHEESDARPLPKRTTSGATPVRRDITF